MQRLPSTGSDLITAIAAALAVGAVAAFAATGITFRDATDVAVHPATMAVLLCLVTIPLIRWAVSGDSVLFRIVLGGVAARCLGTYLRFALTGDGDNNAYHRAGSKIAGWLSDDFVLPGNLPESFGDTGTDWLSYMVGWLYYFTGPNRVTGYVVLRSWVLSARCSSTEPLSQQYLSSTAIDMHSCSSICPRCYSGHRPLAKKHG